MRPASTLLAALAALMIALAPAAPAEARRRDKESRSYTLDERTGKKLNEVQELLQAGEYDRARAMLGKLNRNRLKAYPTALVERAYMILAVNNDDWKEASVHLQRIVELNALPPTQQMAMRFNLGQIYLMLDRWDDAIATLKEWFAETESPSGVAYYMLALAYYQSGAVDQALEPAKQAVALSDNPKESWLQLLLSLHIQQEHFEDALPLLERLVLRYPKRVYWTQLAAVLAQLGREVDSLAAQQLALASGMLETDRELVRLSQTCVVQGIPWQGAKVLREGLESGKVESDAEAWRILANALLASRENAMALEPLKRAAELSPDGDTFVQLGQVHLQAERWQDAIDAFDKALDKGGLKKPGQVYLLIGVAAYQQKRLPTAKRALTRAMNDDEFGDTARQWMDFVEREQARTEAEAAAEHTPS